MIYNIKLILPDAIILSYLFIYKILKSNTYIKSIFFAIEFRFCKQTTFLCDIVPIIGVIGTIIVLDWLRYLKD